MPSVHLTAAEARRVKATRARNKSRNAVLYEVVARLKPRLKSGDPIEASVVELVLRDIRKMVRS
jgi:hypothetical protein